MVLYCKWEPQKNAADEGAVGLMRHWFSHSLAMMVALAVVPEFALAQVQLPGSADAGRIDQREERMVPESNMAVPSRPATVMPPITAPEQSKHVTMKLEQIRITGMTVFATAQVEDIYAPYIGKEITMDKLWLIAGQVTERYRQAGYFLSQVMVPEQEIKDGVVILHVMEGYVGAIQFEDALAKKSLIKKWLDTLQSYRPLKTSQLESVLLHLNDLPGVSLRAVLEPLKDATAPGAVRLVLERRESTLYSGQVSFDNNGSKFLGPYQMSAQAKAVVLPMQQTSVMLLASQPTDELKYGTIRHEVPVMMAGTIEVYASKTRAAPGYTLAVQEIRSDSSLLGTAFRYQIIRQRQENLSARVALEARDTESDILGTPLTRDSVRALRGSLDYEFADSWRGYNVVNAALSQGVSAFGASKANALNLSRTEAEPGFTKLQVNVSRMQGLTADWMMTAMAAAQVASGPLYSSEEFGYGGQAFGRAYDDSEITGDHGVAATAELRYVGLAAWNGLQAVPYGFYDIGLLWNDDRDQVARATGSSGGAGVRLLSDAGFSADLGVAFPLTREVSNPLEGNGSNPRYRMQVSYGF